WPAHRAASAPTPAERLRRRPPTRAGLLRANADARAPAAAKAHPCGYRRSSLRGPGSWQIAETRLPWTRRTSGQPRGGPGGPWSAGLPARPDGRARERPVAQRRPRGPYASEIAQEPRGCLEQLPPRLPSWARDGSVNGKDGHGCLASEEGVR